MTKYVIKRILYMFLTMFVITVMCFVLIKLLPLPAVREMGRDINLVLAKREKMGYNKPIMVQFFLYLKSIFTEWDWGVGEQMYEGLGIWDVMMQKLPYTIVVNLYSILISIPLGLGLGIYAALKKNKWQDAVISTLVMVFISVPSYVYAFLVQYFLYFKLNIPCSAGRLCRTKRNILCCNRTCVAYRKFSTFAGKDFAFVINSTYFYLVIFCSCGYRNSDSIS